MLFSLFVGWISAQNQAIKINPGQILKQSTVVAQAVYKLPSDEALKEQALKIQGNNLTIDFNGAMLEGTPQSTDPDKRQGLGVLVQGKNITIKNLNIRGYKIGLLAEKCEGLRLVNCNFSNNWKQKLLSNLEQENESDWMSYHHNESREWFRYGAGAYLEDCISFEVKNLTVRNGQCGLMLSRSSKGKVWNSDCSFNSGLGLGMYRSSENVIMHNKFDWCVRGYSHGVYNRGQDSAGILIFEQCHKNTFAYNSATHGGDGFFLWAGQTTMDSGEGGCNDNNLYANDFSHSPANAIEATFSRNSFVNNLLIDSWHGIWGGYSYDTQIIGNIFALNGESIAIEHGQKNLITLNSFTNDTVSVYLWQNSNAPDPNWGYPKKKDVRNFGTVVSKNLIADTADTAIILGSGSQLQVTENALVNTKKPLALTGSLSNVLFARNSVASNEELPTQDGVKLEDNAIAKSPSNPSRILMTRGGNSVVENEYKGAAYFARFHTNWTPDVDLEEAVREAEKSSQTIGLDSLKNMAKYYVKPLPEAQNSFLPEGAFRGRKYIIMGEWGPYDFERPLMWARAKLTTSPGVIEQQFEVLGPKGRWSLKSASQGVQVSADSGNVPGVITVKYPSNSKVIEVNLTYNGEKTHDERGIVSPAGADVPFGWSLTRFPIDWSIDYFAWEETQDPRTHESEFNKILEGKSLAHDNTDRLSFATSGSPMANVPANHFATVAKGKLEVEEGSYEVKVTSDDGVRLWVDGQLILDEWHWQAPTNYSKLLNLSKGVHEILVHHFEIDGYTALKVEFQPKK